MLDEVSKDQFHFLCDIIQKSPEHSVLFATGFRTPRHPDAIRIIIGSLQHDGLDTFLEKIGWRGGTILPELSGPAGGCVDHYNLVLDLTDDLVSPIGLECWLPRENNLIAGNEFLEVLSRQFLGTITKRQKSLKWVTENADEHESMGNGHRWINHYKLQIDTSGIREVNGLTIPAVNPPSSASTVSLQFGSR